MTPTSGPCMHLACARRGIRFLRRATAGRRLARTVRAERPAALILDLWMPALNGFEVLEQLRYDPCASGLKVVVLSNMSDADSRLESFGAGAVSYLVKGIALTDLIAEIGRILRDDIAIDGNVRV